ncbi:hypothetical protein C9E81_10930 [Paracoccus alkanivorans]|uniref:Aminotransferase class I/II-fold pyridoxal phosphate-dependent enzyme n=1 Tax=Paracoccus alkanivorans TaxID=2116655 RepID=A0A3M0MD76_9RHOB|nr:hypothetical protein C9E81_10930 [Paracoccus alkanivorans]
MTSGKLLSGDIAFADYLLAEARVATVSGGVYEMPGHFRISTACANDLLDAAMFRISRAVATFTEPENILS